MRLVAAVLLALLATAGCGGTDDGGEKPRTYHSYVALGDSFTSGPGILPVVDGPCARSGHNYPHLLAQRLGIRELDDVSCASASTLHLVLPQRTRSGFVAPPQLDALTPDTDLVTLGLGLNNRGASAMALPACVARGIPSICARLRQQTPASIEVLAGEIGEDVGRALDLIEERAPEADVVVVGYPSPGRATCAAWPAAPPVALRKDLIFIAVDEALERTAEEHGAGYVDTLHPSRAHGACSTLPWLTGAREVPGRGARFHPLDTGQAAVARLVARTLADRAAAD